MFAEVTPARLLAMSKQESRWFDNVKKAFYESDLAYTEGRAAVSFNPNLSCVLRNRSTRLLAVTRRAEHAG